MYQEMQERTNEVSKLMTTEYVEVITSQKRNILNSQDSMFK